MTSGSTHKGLPDFLGVGVSRCGTTWLHQQLTAHPDVYMPTKRKEISYFDRYYERGEDWYSEFFPQGKDQDRYKAIGEISPRYIDNDEIFERVAKFGPAKKYILMVRNPLKRLISAYNWKKRNTNYQGTLEEYITDDPVAMSRCKFGEITERMYKFVAPETVLIVVLEDVAKNPQKELSRLAAFLEIDPKGFPAELSSKVINKNTLPRNKAVYAFAQKIRRALVNSNMDWVVNGVKKLKLQTMLVSAKTSSKNIEDGALPEVLDIFAADIEKFESRLGRKIEAWAAIAPDQ